MAAVKAGTKTLRRADIDDARAIRLETILWHDAIKADGLSGCWIANIYRMENGYGTVSWAGKIGTKRLAHRVSYALKYGEAPADRLVCHSCDNRGCTNPQHMFLATAKGNTTDMLAKGRNRPDRPGRRVLSEDLVLQIRSRYESGDSARALSREFGINERTLNTMLQRKSWAWVA